MSIAGAVKEKDAPAAVQTTITMASDYQYCHERRASSSPFRFWRLQSSFMMKYFITSLLLHSYWVHRRPLASIRYFSICR